MQPRERANKPGNNNDKMTPLECSSLTKKETSEIVIKPSNIPDGSRFKGYQTFTTSF